MWTIKLDAVKDLTGRLGVTWYREKSTVESQRPEFNFYLYNLDQILELPYTCLCISEVGLIYSALLASGSCGWHNVIMHVKSVLRTPKYNGREQLYLLIAVHIE